MLYKKENNELRECVDRYLDKVVIGVDLKEALKEALSAARAPTCARIYAAKALYFSPRNTLYTRKQQRCFRTSPVGGLGSRGRQRHCGSGQSPEVELTSTKTVKKMPTNT